MVQGAVRAREYERDGLKQRVVEVRAETVEAQGRRGRPEREQLRSEPDWDCRRGMWQAEAEERDREEDDAMELFQRLGLDSNLYLPDY
jgi:hypothetical protein